MLALGVVGIVGHYSHFHRTNRIKMPLPELAQFVARWVVHSVAADDEAALVALRAPVLTPVTKSLSAYLHAPCKSAMLTSLDGPLAGGFPLLTSTRSCPMRGQRPPRRSARRQEESQDGKRGGK